MLPDERELLIIDLLTNNEDCQLPCWLDIFPGETSWEEVYNSFNHLGLYISTIGEKFPINSIFTLDNFTTISFEIVFNEDTVWRMRIESQNPLSVDDFYSVWKNYSPQNVISTYGKPTLVEVGVDLPSEPPGSSVGYDIWLYYQNLGFVIIYPGSAPLGDTLKLCPGYVTGNLSGRIYLYLHSGVKEISYSVLIDRYQHRHLNNMTLEEATGLSIDEFYSLFIGSETDPCIETPVEIWYP